MPSFSRLGRHSNRSQHALEPQASSSGGAGTTGVSVSAGASATAAAAAAAATEQQRSQPSQQQQHHQRQQSQTQHQVLLDEADLPAHNTSTATRAHSTATPHSALSSSHNTAYSSSESFDSRPPPPPHHPQQQPPLQGGQQTLLHHPPPPSLQQQQSQSQAQSHPPPPLSPSHSTVSSTAPPPLHIYSSPSAASSTTAAINNPGSLQQSPNPNQQGSSPIFDGNQPRDFVDRSAGAIGRSQSIRYSTHISQQQPGLPYGIATSSVDDLNSAANYGRPLSSQPQQGQLGQQSQQGQQERRSTRSKFIRGIFGAGHKSSNPEKQQQQQQQQQQQHSILGHSQQPSYDNTSGLSRRQSKSNRNSRIPNTIRHVSGPVLAEVDPQQPTYDDTVYHQQEAPLQQQPHVQVHPQDQQQPHFDTGAYDQQSSSPQNPPQQGYSFTNPHQQQQAQYPPSAIQGGESRIAHTHLGPSSHQQNPETVSQFSHESPITDSDQRSANLHSAHTSPAVNHSVYVQNHGSTPSLPPIQQTTPQPQQSGMAPPTGGPPPSRRNPDADQALRGQVDVPGGPPPAYRHGTAPLNTMSPLPPVPGQAQSQGTPLLPGQPPVYRGERPPAPNDQGRDSPQPTSAVPSDPSEGDKAFKDLLTKYKNVKRLYFDGKSQIDALGSQIEQLQNAVANQRMSQSRTALDDSEYSTRFNRLNGAINNLSFNIRKDWRCVPQWLDKYVSADALKTGKQEMTAVGRAVISRWLVEEVFNKCFHPGLDPQLSQSLKEIELSIRHNAYTMSSQEEFEALTSKVVSWRMTTLDGLSRELNSPSMTENRTLFTEKATSNLTACLYQFLNSPPPPGVEGSTSMIIELAVGIAVNLPMESRDVAISYPLPRDIVQPQLMEVEKTPLPALEANEEGAEGNNNDEGENNTGTFRTAPKPKPGAVGRESSEVSISEVSNTDVNEISALPQEPSRVRFAGFIALEVRGRQVLMKAPVWTL